MNVHRTLIAWFVLVFAPSLTAHAEDTEPVPAEAEWGFNQYTDLMLGATYDQNFHRLHDDLSVGDLSGGIHTEILPSREKKFAVGDHVTSKRFFQIGLGAGVFGVLQERNKSQEPSAGSLRVTFDGDVQVCHRCYLRPMQIVDRRNKRIKRTSIGTQFELVRSELDRDPFRDVFRVSPALMLTLRAETHCELDNVVVYGRHEEHSDRSRFDDPAFDRSGARRALGIKTTVFQRKDASYDCGRRGPFQRMDYEPYWSLALGVEREAADTDGDEFHGRQTLAYARYRYPIQKTVKHRPRGHKKPIVVSLEGNLQVAERRFRASQLDSMEPRHETLWKAGGVLRAHLTQFLRSRRRFDGFALDGAFSVGVELNDSNIRTYDYDRWFATLGVRLRVIRGSGEYYFFPQSSGAQTPSQSGSSGDSRPVVAENLEMDDDGGMPMP